ncbi:MAG: hypothetical protein HYV90_02395 [Candidatus Woesebacteria bacterium]|nr:MAG: hypothetical protein HYV90_02395 [Candidatus Woesebacteria bacterium]
MKVVNNKTLPGVSLVSFLEKRIKTYQIEIRVMFAGVNPYYRDYRSILDHTFEIVESRHERDNGGRVIGGIVKGDSNKIIIYDDVYLQIIEELVKQYEAYSPGTEITIELRDWPTPTRIV